MRKLFSAATAVSLLLASLLVLQPTANAQTQGERSVPLYLDNTEAVSSGAVSGKQVVNVSVKPVNNCQPRTPLISGGNYALQPQGDVDASNDRIAGILDSHCNYEITYSDAAGQCPVNVSLIGADGNGVGAVISNQRPLAVNVDYNNGDITANGSGAFVRIHFAIDRSDTNQCGSIFQPTVDIDVPNEAAFRTPAGVSIYGGLEFDVKFTPVAGRGSGCTAALVRKMSVDKTANSGAVVWHSVGGQSASAPTLVNVSRTEKEAGRNVSCQYQVTFPSESGSLALQQTGLRTLVEASSARTTATYLPKSVDIEVTAVFPADAVFTTNDKVSVNVVVNPPCGGFIKVLPRSLFGQGDRGESQVFPGGVIIYGKQLNAISNVARRYSVPAYADALGTQACSVTASVSTNVARCSTTMPTLTAGYSSGKDSLSIEFPFSCDGDTSEASITPEKAVEEPPAPPSIVIGGPLPEGRTG